MLAPTISYSPSSYAVGDEKSGTVHVEERAFENYVYYVFWSMLCTGLRNIYVVIHHQFESIHPFYDGNGRTGRIISILYLVINNLLDLPILYLSRYITHNKGTYYRLIQAIRDSKEDRGKAWEEWILFMLKGVEITADDTIMLVKGINSLMTRYKQILRPLFGKQYKHELLNNLFFHPYTKIEFVEQDMQVQRKTATKYLDMIVRCGLIEKVKIWKTNYYINTELVNLFLNRNAGTTISLDTEIIESVREQQ